MFSVFFMDCLVSDRDVNLHQLHAPVLPVRPGGKVEDRARTGCYPNNRTCASLG